MKAAEPRETGTTERLTCSVTVARAGAGAGVVVVAPDMGVVAVGGGGHGGWSGPPQPVLDLAVPVLSQPAANSPASNAVTSSPVCGRARVTASPPSSRNRRRENCLTPHTRTREKSGVRILAPDPTDTRVRFASGSVGRIFDVGQAKLTTADHYRSAALRPRTDRRPPRSRRFQTSCDRYQRPARRTARDSLATSRSCVWVVADRPGMPAWGGGATWIGTVAIARSDVATRPPAR